MVSTNDTIPAACYSICQNAFNIAQKIGKSSALCVSDSTFTTEYNACIDCCVSNGGSPNSIEDGFSPYLEYCNAAPANPASPTSPPGLQLTIPSSYVSISSMFEPTTITVPQITGTPAETFTVPITLFSPIPTIFTLPAWFTHLSVESIISSYIPSDVFDELAASVSSAASAASVTGDPTSLVYSALEDASPPAWFRSAVPSTYSGQISTLRAQINAFTATGSLSSSAATTSAAPSSPSSGTDQTSSGEPSSKAWIAGAVVGPIAIIAFLLVGVLLFRRRRQRKQAPADPDGELKVDKPQLHGNSLPAPQSRVYYEMDGENTQHPRELPATDNPQELAANGSPH